MTQAVIIAAIGFGCGAFVVLIICVSIIVYRVVDAPSHIIEAHRKGKDVVLYAQRDDNPFERDPHS